MPGTPLEKSDRLRVKNTLQAAGFVVKTLHGGPHQRDLPDLLAVRRGGLAAFVEMKRRDRDLRTDLTPKQAKVLHEMAAQGAYAAAVRFVDEPRPTKLRVLEFSGLGPGLAMNYEMELEYFPEHIGEWKSKANQ